MVVHNRYRSSAPSGENRVVDRERAALAELGHEVVRFERDSDVIEGWSLPRKAALPGLAVWSPGAFRELRRVLAEQRPDVVHVHNTFPLLSPAVLYACRDASVPVVLTLHNYRLACAGGNFLRAGQVCHDCVDGSAVQAIAHGCYKGSRLASTAVVAANAVHRQAWRSMVSAYVFISASQRDLLAGLDLDAGRVFVRHNLIPAREVPVVPRADVVLYAGRLDTAKGVRLLMAGWDCYLRARDGDGGLRLVIAGAGVLEPEVTAWAAGRPSVELAGHVDEAGCAALMARARAVVLPSTWEEPFGLVAVEAMAAGAPPIAAGHGAFTELITHGVDGVLFAPGDAQALGAAVADVEADPDRYLAYGAQARETYAKHFDPDRNIEQLVEIYRYAIANPA
ncbi:MAG TPA: glycosyltransferase [Streptosporangiaceae bacterium]|nr:glycosyltransferase [Streptosporangiaceae bacterium]